MSQHMCFIPYTYGQADTTNQQQNSFSLNLFGVSVSFSTKLLREIAYWIAHQMKTISIPNANWYSHYGKQYEVSSKN